MTSAFGGSERKREIRVPTMRTGRAGRCAIGGCGIGLRAAAALAFAAALSGGLSAAQAQAEDPAASFNEVPIGTFKLGPSHDGFSIVEPPAGVPERKRDNGDDGSGRWFFQNWQTSPRQNVSAEDLYADALKALEDGRKEEAQRLFERLIAEAPNSPRAGAARQHLGKIYRGAEPEAVGSLQADGNAGEDALPWAVPGQAEAAGPAALELSQPLSRAVLYQARVSPTIDARFLSAAGDRVFFSAGSTNLGSRAQSVIQSQARFLVRYPELSVAVEGYADDGPLSNADTIRLSEQRAAVVRERLIAEGVEPERIVAYGRGREDRVSDCPAPECLAQNRRAVTVLLSRRVEAKPLRRVQGASAPSTAPAPQ